MAKVSPARGLRISLPSSHSERCHASEPAAAPSPRLPSRPPSPSQSRVYAPDTSSPAIADTSGNDGPSVPIDTGKRAIPGPIVCDGNARNRHKGPHVSAPPRTAMRNSPAQNNKMSKRGGCGEAGGRVPGRRQGLETRDSGKHRLACSGQDPEGLLTTSITFHASGRMFPTDCSVSASRPSRTPAAKAGASKPAPTVTSPPPALAPGCSRQRTHSSHRCASTCRSRRRFCNWPR
jgi:hypothetical protein